MLSQNFPFPTQHPPQKNDTSCPLCRPLRRRLARNVVGVVSHFQFMDPLSGTIGTVMITNFGELRCLRFWAKEKEANITDLIHWKKTCQEQSFIRLGCGKQTLKKFQGYPDTFVWALIVRLTATVIHYQKTKVKNWSWAKHTQCVLPFSMICKVHGGGDDVDS